MKHSSEFRPPISVSARMRVECTVQRNAVETRGDAAIFARPSPRAALNERIELVREGKLISCQPV